MSLDGKIISSTVMERAQRLLSEFRYQSSGTANDACIVADAVINKSLERSRLLASVRVLEELLRMGYRLTWDQNNHCYLVGKDDVTFVSGMSLSHLVASLKSDHLYDVGLSQ